MVDTIPENAELVRIREEHIRTESNIRGIGSLFILGSVFLIVAGVLGLFLLIQEGFYASDFSLVLLYLFLGVFAATVGIGLMRFRPSARIPGAVLSGLMMLNIPLGTLIGAYFLYNLVGDKGRYVFTPDYQAIRAAPPHVKLKSSLASKIVLGLLVVLLIALICWVALSSR